MAIGYNFQPGAQDMRLDQQGQGGSSPKGLSPQQAVKILSLRVPDRGSPAAIAPQALLQSKGSMGAGSLGSILKALMDIFAQGGDMGDVPTSAGMPTPLPRVIPGSGKSDLGPFESSPSPNIPNDFPLPGGAPPDWAPLPMPNIPNDFPLPGGAAPDIEKIPGAPQTGGLEDWLNWKKGQPGNGLTPLF